MKTMTIQQPEHYEAPKVKVKALRRRGVICASDPTNTYGGYSESEEEG